MNKIHIGNAFWDFSYNRCERKNNKKLIRIVHLMRLLHLYVNSLISSCWTGKKIIQWDRQNICNYILLHSTSIQKKKTKVSQLKNNV